MTELKRVLWLYLTSVRDNGRGGLAVRVDIKRKSANGVLVDGADDVIRRNTRRHSSWMILLSFTAGRTISTRDSSRHSKPADWPMANDTDRAKEVCPYPNGWLWGGLFHPIRYRQFKVFYLNPVCRHLRAEFPRLPTYPRCVELMPRCWVVLTALFEAPTGSAPGYRFYCRSPPDRRVRQLAEGPSSGVRGHGGTG